MELNEKQLEMCTASRWDFSDLRAIFLNCTLKKSPEMSHTEGLWQICKAIFEKNGVQVDELRVIDHQVAFGVWGDTTEHGYQRDDWPQIYTRVKAATIVVIGSSIWLGEKTSVCTMLIERLYANSHLLNEHGQYADYGKVDGCLITGNEDGAKHCSMNILYSLSHLGYDIPPQADSGWLGPVGPGPSYLDPGSGGPERLHQPQHDVHDVEPHAPRPHDQGHWRHPGPRQPTVEVGCGMSLRLSQPRAPLAVCGESPAAFDRRCIPPGGVVPRSQTAGIFPRRALQEPGAASLRTGLDATLGSPRTASASPRPSHFRS